MELDESSVEMLNNQNDQTNVSMERDAPEEEVPNTQLAEIPEVSNAPNMLEYPTDDEPDKKVEQKFIDLEADGANQRQKSFESGGVLSKAKQGSDQRGAEKYDEYEIFENR